MALFQTELSRDSSENLSEVLPDGTVHHKISLTRSRTDSVDKVAETIETFEHPPHLVQDIEEIEEVKPDGSKVVRHVSLNQVVHSVETHYETLDPVTGRMVEHCEVQEVVPNTTSAFDAGVDSDYEEEMQEKARSLSVDTDTEEIEEVQPDGTVVKRKITLNRVVHVSRSRSDSFDKRDGLVREEYPSEEVVPGTVSAFDAGQDSDEK